MATDRIGNGIDIIDKNRKYSNNFLHNHRSSHLFGLTNTMNLIKCKSMSK